MSRADACPVRRGVDNGRGATEPKAVLLPLTSRKQMEEVKGNLEPIYPAVTATVAPAAFDDLAEKSRRRHPVMIRLWRKAPSPPHSEQHPPEARNAGRRDKSVADIETPALSPAIMEAAEECACEIGNRDRSATSDRALAEPVPAGSWPVEQAGRTNSSPSEVAPGQDAFHSPHVLICRTEDPLQYGHDNAAVEGSLLAAWTCRVGGHNNEPLGSHHGHRSK